MTYQTVLGDTWDIIAKKVYGKEVYADRLMEANPDLLEEFIFSAGVTVECPEIETDAATLPEAYPEWRT